MAAPDEPKVARFSGILTDYGMLYIADERCPTQTFDDWTDENEADRMLVAPGAIVVSTGRLTLATAVVELRAALPSDEGPTGLPRRLASASVSYDHITEASLEIASGRLIVGGGIVCMRTGRRIAVTPGCFRARIYFGDRDHYIFQLWPAPAAVPTVLKRGPRRGPWWG